MLIDLIKLDGTVLLVNTDHIVKVVPLLTDGSQISLANGDRIDVVEELDDISGLANDNV